MTDTVDNATNLVRHGVAWLDFRSDYSFGEQREVLASRLFPKLFWEHLLKQEPDEFSITYQLYEPGILRIYVKCHERYCADDVRACDDINFGYFGDVKIANASGSDLFESAVKMVMSHARTWAGEQLRLSTMAAA